MYQNNEQLTVRTIVWEILYSLRCSNILFGLINEKLLQKVHKPMSVKLKWYSAKSYIDHQIMCIRKLFNTNVPSYMVTIMKLENTERNFLFSSLPAGWDMFHYLTLCR